MNREQLCDWLLLNSDPAIQWQALRDLTSADPARVDLERSHVATRGWGKQLLAAQDTTGRWADALYSPKWTSTTYTLLLLRGLGLPEGNEQALAGCGQLWSGARDHGGGGLNFSKGVTTPETCETAMVVQLTAYFGYRDERQDATVRWLLTQQLDDGGWNCETLRTGSRHGSFHTSIIVLESLLDYRNGGGPVVVDDALDRGREFFLAHRLFKSHRTNSAVDPAFTRFPFPPQWHFDVLRGLDFFRRSGAEPDERLGDAVEALLAAQNRDGRWPYYRPYPGRQWFVMESRGPSRWNTLRASRVLDWWNSSEDSRLSSGTW